MLAGRDFTELIDARAETTPEAQMSVDEAGTSMTFAAYRDAVARAAAGLAARGIGAGDVVSWALPTRHSSLVLIGALCRLGAVQNPILPIYRDREVGFCTAQAGTKLLILPSTWRDFDFAAMGERIAEANGLETLICDPDLPEGDAADAPAPPEPPATRADEAVTWIFYTSGTTSDPKGARHSDADLLVTARGMGDRLELRGGDRNLMAFPVTHIAGPLWLGCSLLYGMTNVITEAFNPTETPALASRQDVTLAGSATPFHLAYLNAQRQQPDTPLFPSLRNCPGGGAPKPPKLHHEIQDELGGQGIVSGWGLSEAPILTMASAQDPDEKLATTEGRAMPGVQLRAVRLDDGTDAAPGEEGELLTKAPQLMRGYLDATLDQEAFDEEGWFRTGDVGVIDAAGYVRITDRLKDVIVRKGENVSAKELEDLLYEHDAVAEVAVVGLPDDERGELVCAVIAGTEGAEPITIEVMKDYLTARGLRVQAVPERVEYVEAMPRNAAGKVPKHELRAQYAPA